jgi:hypothetical protein
MIDLRPMGASEKASSGEGQRPPDHAASLFFAYSSVC